ncbi:MAG: bifunctional diguanylate cyclase/phosphodiesterase [Lachnospiraceae bacterium]|nr:bifunctional diguanylate cyclase/phosphodiesterase [Lachnospiraceae bacterium]MBQ6441032.1 bifunctional diguanylate cyclase/phosphodiesterase [Lachnospiraceae bacterium]
MNEERLIQREYDPVTGLHTLTGFFSFLRNIPAAQDKSGTVIFLDILNFKDFNQRYGYANGDVLLRGVAHEIIRLFPECIACRSSADLFIVILPLITEEAVRDLLQQLQDAIHQYERGIRLTLKAGVYFSDGTEPDPAFATDYSKIACNHAKQSFDQDIFIYDQELAKKEAFHQYVMAGFPEALKKGYIKTYYQREVRALTGQNCGYEALARWEDPEYGMISPAVFVTVLEDAHQIHKLDLYMVENVCKDIRLVMDVGMEAQPVSVNLSRLDFTLCDIFEEVQRIRQKYDLLPSMLNIEITESAFVDDTEALDRAIELFREAGYKIWMDDFGAGYSSLNNLKSYQFDVLKIDMNFLREFETNPRSHVILASIVNMAKELGMHTLAEGVETQEQYDFLRSIGCEKLQGFLIGKPVPFQVEYKNNSLVNQGAEISPHAKNHPEPHEMQIYYDRIGEVNVLGNMPLKRRKGSVESLLPISIVEVVDAQIIFIYGNNAYLRFLNDLGIPSLEALNARTKVEGLPENEAFRKLAAKAEESQVNEIADVVINGNVCSMELEFLSRAGNRSSFVMLSHNLSKNAEAKQATDLEAVFRYMLHLFFRVDLFDEDGTVENIYLSVDQDRITDQETDSHLAVDMYAERYIRREDRQRFIRFYDMSTLRERVKAGGKDYVTEMFHANGIDYHSVIQMYSIVPFQYEGRWKALSCCRQLDEMW